LRVLEEHGFEPRAEDGAVSLANCPFHSLAREHTALVCGMNLALLDGLLESLPGTGLTARLAPDPGRCCVRLEPAGAASPDPLTPE
jgi:predicted ArsR family transcriptional regulator